MINYISSQLPSGVERVCMAVGGAVGGAFSFAFGDVKPLIFWLAVFVTCDFVSAWLAAIKNKNWSSSKLFFGVIKKVVMFSIIALAHGLDETLHDLCGVYFVQSVVIVAYTAGEFASIIRNLESAGLGGAVPQILRYILYAINQYLEDRASKTLPIDLKPRDNHDIDKH